jgi:hypothetical protein
MTKGARGCKVYRFVQVGKKEVVLFRLAMERPCPQGTDCGLGVCKEGRIQSGHFAIMSIRSISELQSAAEEQNCFGCYAQMVQRNRCWHFHYPHSPR